MFLSVLFITLAFEQAFPAPLKGRLFYEKDYILLSPGMVFDAVLSISPVKENESFPSLQNTLILNALHVAKVEKKTLKGDVLSFHIKAVFKRHMDTLIVHRWSFGDRQISLRIENMDVKESPHKKEKNFIIYHQKGNLKKWDTFSIVIYTLIFSALLCLVLLVVYWRKTREEKRRRQRRRGHYLKWKKIFSNAKNRDDYESISSKKNEWMVLCSDNRILAGNFLNSINSCQYKKKWSQKELSKVEASFGKIRKILKEQI